MRPPKSVDEHIERGKLLVKELPAEDELTGPSSKERLLGEADAILRALPEDYLRGLPADVQEKIRDWLARRSPPNPPTPLSLSEGQGGLALSPTPSPSGEGA
jgi:hypothetical protein